MTPAARISAAIEVLDQILTGAPAEQALLRWSRSSRFAGSGDRAAVRDQVFEALRRRNSLAASGGALTGRGLMIGYCRENGTDPALMFTGNKYAPEPLSAAEESPGMSAARDLPDWLWPRWQESLGEQAEPVLAAMALRAPLWLRVNGTLGGAAQAIEVLAADGITAEVTPLLSSALMVTGGNRKLNNSRAYREGLVEVQDLSPQLACATLVVHPGQKVLDYCAGGGGKALALAGRIADLSITAHDANPRRMADLPERARRAGIEVRLTDQPAGLYDLVIADVPCSGSGTWRREPDAKWRLTSGELQRLTRLQLEILNDAAAFVADGGQIAYMTCSVLAAENEQIVDQFIMNNQHFSEILRQNWNPVTASDGFFLSVLRR